MQQVLAGAIQLHKQGRGEQAQEVYQAVLNADPDNASALHFLGVLRHQQGRSLQAVELVRKALALDPDYVDAQNNLGNIYLELSALEDAAAAYRGVLSRKPDHGDALRNLAIALRRLKCFDEAIAMLTQAITGSPANITLRYNLATTYREAGRFNEALATLQEALVLRPDADGFRRLGAMLYAVKRVEDATANYARWLALEPDNPVAKHMLAACSGRDIPARADDAFVARVFDGFADSFDEVLTRLEYRAPTLVGLALAGCGIEPRGQLDILDAGCGTGLLGQFLRPYARRLVGVDLSPKMLEKAAKRALYDAIVPAELAAYLRSTPEAFDVVASSDTLVYFGDLNEAFRATRTSLRPGGRFLFTVERVVDDARASEGYHINPHGRYSHTPAYLRDSLAAADLELAEMQDVQLRREGDHQVEGLLVVACRR